MRKSRREKEEERKNGDIINMLDTALDEDISEISEISSLEESAAAPSEPMSKRAFHFIIGLIFLSLAVVGMITTVNYIREQLSGIINNTQQKNEFAKFIYPVVICDPPGFDQNTSLKNETIISAAVWDIILYEDKSRYELDFDYLLVPEVDVEQHAAKLFGSGLNVTHTTISSADISFYYDDEISCYRVPEDPRFFTYSPYIESISKVGESYTLTVGYVSPTPAWFTLSSDEAPLPEKYVDYVVQKRGTSYTLVAIKQSAMQAETGHDTGL